MQIHFSRRAIILLMLASSFLVATPASRADDKLSLKDGDRIVWIGGTLIEREQVSGYWETMLAAALPDKTITNRNLGWSGDTVWCDSRGMFDPADQGYARTLELATAQKPTLIILAYGGNEAFAGEPGLSRFLEQYRKLVSDLSKTGARFAFLLPIDMDPAACPSPSEAEHYNQLVETYRKAIRDLAHELKAPVIDLSHPAADEKQLKNCPLTSDGMHLTACGYWAYAHRLRDQIEDANKDVTLPVPADPYPTAATVSTSDRLERIRSEIVQKNELFFHRWRPQNFTYIFGFRKHEQGNNAVEIPQFDPLIEKREAEIAKLQKAGG
jgi:lysophospholipase L1-like esterase